MLLAFVLDVYLGYFRPDLKHPMISVPERMPCFRISGITVLLAFSVFMLAVAENLPETSEFVPLISKYFTKFLICSCS